VGFGLSISTSSSQTTEETPWAVIHTDRGAIVIELYEKLVPRAVGHFVALVKGTQAWVNPKTKQSEKKPFYDGLSFHRILPTYLIQGGCPLDNGRGDAGVTLKDEFHPQLTHQSAGMVGFANVGTDTSSSQFYITLRSTPWLDAKRIRGRYCENFTTPIRCVTNLDCQAYAKQFSQASDGDATCKEREMKRGYTIFGKVAQGMDTVTAISESPLGGGDRPATPIKIKRILIHKGKRWQRSWLRPPQ
jgi:peptidyl-prolyl cis-trans isomerase A (cyclophilin A)